MRILIILYLALGLSLMVCIEYSCQGSDIFPTYYASPFIFKQKSLGSSMEYFYDISGLVLNMLTWSTLLYILDRLTQKVSKTKKFKAASTAITSILVIVTTITIIINFIMIGPGFSKNLNYWYWTIEEVSDNARFECERQLRLFTKNE